MTGTILGILLGILVVIAISALTGYFVAQEFGYMAVDRSRLKARAAAGDAGAARALDITRRTSFMLSGAQLGITVTGLVVGYVAEPLIGNGIGELLGVSGVPVGVGIAIGTTIALLLSTIVQMILGELFPKNLAIARPEPVARRLALSTKIYLAAFGWLILLFDAASNALLKLLRIEAVHDVEHSATPRDLTAIIEDSRESGDLSPDMAALLDRAVAFEERSARAAMIPRARVAWVHEDDTLASLVAGLAADPTRQHSRYPVLGTLGAGVGEPSPVGLLSLRDLLSVQEDHALVRVRRLMRPAVLVPSSLPLPQVLNRLRSSGEELACVLDEYGGLAGVITLEDIAEELVGEITDEHDSAATDQTTIATEGWRVPGDQQLQETARLIGVALPAGEYQTIGGLVTAHLQRLPNPGDQVRLSLPGDLPDDTERQLILTVHGIVNRVPATVSLQWRELDDPARRGDAPR